MSVAYVNSHYLIIRCSMIYCRLELFVVYGSSSYISWLKWSNHQLIILADIQLEVKWPFIVTWNGNEADEKLTLRRSLLIWRLDDGSVGTLLSKAFLNCRQQCQGSRSRQRSIIRNPIYNRTCGPLEEIQPCSIEFRNCWTYEWQVSDWGSCIPLGGSQCGEGTQARALSCVRNDGYPVHHRSVPLYN